MTESRRVNEIETMLSKLAVGGEYRTALRLGDVAVGFVSGLKGLRQDADRFILSFDNGVTVEGRGGELAERCKFYRRIW